MMVALVAAVAMLTVGFVLWPFVRRVVPECPGSDPAGDASAELRLQQMALYDALGELEFACQAGQYAPEDYQRLRVHYEQQAAAVLQALDDQRQSVTVPPPGVATSPGDDPWSETVALAGCCGVCSGACRPGVGSLVGPCHLRPARRVSTSGGG